MELYKLVEKIQGEGKMIKKVTILMLSIALLLVMPMPALASDNQCAEGHAWTYWWTEIEPTCVPGKERWHCENCGCEEERSVPAIYSHDWEGWEVIKLATILKKGKQSNYCYGCGKVITRDTNKLKPYAKFAKKKYTVSKGKSIKLKPKFARGDKVKKWKTSKKSVATVNKNGKVVGKKTGTVKITVIMKSGKKATCKVKVTKPKKVKKSKMVYVTATGVRYHSRTSCYGLRNANATYKISKSEAISEGYSPCHVCYR